MADISPVFDAFLIGNTPGISPVYSAFADLVGNALSPVYTDILNVIPFAVSPTYALILEALTPGVRGPQIAIGPRGINTQNLVDGLLAATPEGRGKMATGFFDAETAADKFRDGSIPPAKLGGGVIITPWTADTMTGAWVANTSYTCLTRRIGDTLEVRASVRLSGAPTGTLTLEVPGGRAIDHAKLAGEAGVQVPVGSGLIHDAGTATLGAVAVMANASNPTTLGVVTGGTPATALTAVAAAAPILFAIGDRVNVTFAVPILGW